MAQAQRLVDPQTSSTPATTYRLTVTLAGDSTGTVTSSPTGISCAPTCTASFAAGAAVKLTVAPAKGAYFAGWNGACKGNGNTCKVTMNSKRSAIRGHLHLNERAELRLYLHWISSAAIRRGALRQAPLREPQCRRSGGYFEVDGNAVQSAALAKRDATQINMTQCFNFNFPPGMTPPTPPAQSISGPCYLNQLP